jgi:hypothetical protein
MSVGVFSIHGDILLAHFPYFFSLLVFYLSDKKTVGVFGDDYTGIIRKSLVYSECVKTFRVLSEYAELNRLRYNYSHLTTTDDVNEKVF